MEFSFSEILLIVAIALVVMGPKELVKTSHQIGLWIGKIRTQVNNMKVMLNEEVLEDERRELRELVASVTATAAATTTAATTTAAATTAAATPAVATPPTLEPRAPTPHDLAEDPHHG